VDSRRLGTHLFEEYIYGLSHSVPTSVHCECVKMCENSGGTPTYGVCNYTVARIRSLNVGKIR